MPKGLNIAIFTGHFGSGKTEIAINYALQSRRQGKKTVLVDLDIVNPFFRSAEVKPMLEKEGIEVITPVFAATNMDLPSIPPHIYSVFSREDTTVVFDVGGDKDGATALGRFRQYFEAVAYKMFFVINTKRPFTQNPEDILEILGEVEGCARIKVTDLINNTNLSFETTMDMIEKGQHIIEDVASRTNIPITYVSVQKKLVGELPESFTDKLFILDLFMQPKF